MVILYAEISEGFRDMWMTLIIVDMVFVVWIGFEIELSINVNYSILQF